jgi:hypothetical protein
MTQFKLCTHFLAGARTAIANVQLHGGSNTTDSPSRMVSCSRVLTSCVNHVPSNDGGPRRRMVTLPSSSDAPRGRLVTGKGCKGVIEYMYQPL